MSDTPTPERPPADPDPGGDADPDDAEDAS